MEQNMFIAMNRFTINKGHEEAFETVWRERDSRLDEVSGFQSFHLLKGAFNEENNTTLYASHTIWSSREAFVNWTNSNQFRQAHKNAGGSNGMYSGHPQFEGFEAVVSK
jgi:heme-degrading monooxygenase HmoA